jgi:DNA-directed RNA polymerase specialized sigma24 family protein
VPYRRAISEAIVENNTHPLGPEPGRDPREARDAIPDHVTGSAEPTTGPERRHELIEEIFVCMLQKLPPRQRAALLLAHSCNFTLPEIADILDIPVGSARALVREAREALRSGE